MKKVATMAATAPPTPKETPADCALLRVILDEPPFQTMRRARRKDAKKTLHKSARSLTKECSWTTYSI
jgi:hypothetical protein